MRTGKLSCGGAKPILLASFSSEGGGPPQVVEGTILIPQRGIYRIRKYISYRRYIAPQVYRLEVLVVRSAELWMKEDNEKVCVNLIIVFLQNTCIFCEEMVIYKKMYQ